MLQIIDNQEVLGEYIDFNIPVLAQKKLREEQFIVANQSFQDIFFLNQKHHSTLDSSLQKLLKQISVVDDFYWNGSCYKIDKLSKSEGLTLFFISASKDSTKQSFLWLKHDLLNILNPIMGFSDILLESEQITPDNLELIEKINSNSRKIYHQINQISLSQAIAKPYYNLNIEEYDVSTFMNELMDKLIINNSIESHQIHITPCKNDVSAHIASHEFRTVLENQLIIFMQWQDHPQLEISSSINKRSVTIKVSFSNCMIPTNKLRDITKIQQLRAVCKPIDKLQIEGFNYLILAQITDLLGAKMQLIYEENKSCILQFSFPIVKQSNNQSESAILTNNFQNNNSEIKNIKLDIPRSMEIQLKEICANFDGLVILDEWEELATKIEEINMSYHILEIQQIVEEIRTAIRTYHVGKLKKIHQYCKSIFG
jgi:hypothetical protein